MENFREETYGQRIHQVYDAWYQDQPAAAVERLVELAQDGRALELGIGTGRLALPLARRGVEVHGIDASQDMLNQLAAKEGAERITTIRGDFSQVQGEGKFDLIYVVFNTFYALITQDKQVDCFRRAARTLSPGGVFLIEAFVPDLTRFDRGQRVSVTDLDLDGARLDLSRHDPVRQQITSQHIVLCEDGLTLYPIQLRYAWPSELDLMARLAGMKLQERWSTWRKDEFLAESKKHISLYQLEG